VALAASVAALALALPSAASSAPVPLGGSPLNVIVDELGQLQVFRQDRVDPSLPPGIFYPSTAQTGDAGLFLAFPAPVSKVYGFPVTSFLSGITSYTGVTQGGVTGAGTSADPLTQVTTYQAPGLAKVTQTTDYVNGSQEFRVRWVVQNISGPASIHFKALAAADFFFEGSDRGTGIFTEGPPRFIGGTNVDSGSSGGFVEVADSPWSTYQALEWGDGPDQLWGKVNAAAGSTNATFDGTVIGALVDNAGGVEWDQYATGAGLAPAGSRTFAAIVRSAVPSALQMNPTNAASRQGVPVGITATATDSNAQPYAGKTLRYTITGPNATEGATTLGPAGSAVITDPGANAGGDTIVAFVDFDNDGTRELVEPQASAIASFVDVPPTCSLKAKADTAGGAGSGSPIIVTVNCGEGGTVTVSVQLTPPPPPKHSTASRRRKARPIRLKPVRHAVTAGKPFTFKLKVPRKVARRYAGKRLRMLVTITAKDSAGNVKRVKKRSTIRLKRLRRR